MGSGKLREIAEEFRTVLRGRSNLVDSVVPPALFLLLYALMGFEAAMWGSLLVAAGFTALRLVGRQPLRHALGGLGGAVLAIVLVRLLGRAEGYFLPGIITGALTAAGCLVSVLANRPLVAWTSYLARRWPLAWYWHPRVCPAYNEVTLAWAAFFGLRLVLQLLLLQEQATGLLALISFLAGWPATIVLLVASYLYGTWRLRRLGGPGVEEFGAGAPPPWSGQQRGF